MRVSAHFYHIMVQASRKLYAGKFFGNYMLGNWDGHQWLFKGGGGGRGEIFWQNAMLLYYGLSLGTIVPRAGDLDSGNVDLSRQRSAR